MTVVLDMQYDGWVYEIFIEMTCQETRKISQITAKITIQAKCLLGDAKVRRSKIEMHLLFFMMVMDDPFKNNNTHQMKNQESLVLIN